MTTSTNTNTNALGQIADAVVFAPARAIGITHQAVSKRVAGK